MPLIIPGVISGGLFAFITSFDEVVAVLFLASPEQRTIPRQMVWRSRTDQPDNFSCCNAFGYFVNYTLDCIGIVRRRSERLRGITNS